MRNDKKMSPLQDWMYEKYGGPDGMITRELIDEVNIFFDFGFANIGDDMKIVCTCKKYKNGCEQDHNTIMQHLSRQRFALTYCAWVGYGENYQNCGANDYDNGGTSSTPIMEDNCAEIG